MKGLAEYAKSARAACRQCAGKIEKGSLRLGFVEKGGGGFDVTRWFHLQCYFKSLLVKKRGTPASLSASAVFTGFSALKPGDQTQLSALLQSFAEESKAREALASEGGKEEQESADAAAEDGEPPVKKLKTMEPSEAEELAEQEKTISIILSKFVLEKAPHNYKGINLPSPWRAVSTVILHPGPTTEPNEKIAAFDFDGCLARTDVRVMGAEAWSLQYPTVPERLRSYHEQGFKLVIFTNEATIDMYTKARKKAIDSKLGRLDAMLALLEVPVQVFIACGTSYSRDVFRKPAPGMWRILEQLNGGKKIDMERSFYVGDAAGRPQDHSEADIGFAKAVGVKFMVPEEVFL